MMATRAKTSAFLPTIKCSNCNVEIEISMMGDHVCAQPQTRWDRFNNAYASMSAPPSNEPLSSKLARIPPPRIDASGANRSYQQQAIQPNSSTFNNKGSLTPTAAGSGRKSPFRMPPRSATAPLPYSSPPSPDLPLPQDCAFPVFPTVKSRSATPTTPSAGKRSFEGTRTDSSGIAAPRSTRPDAGGFLQKMNDPYARTPSSMSGKAMSIRSNKSAHTNHSTRLNPMDVQWGEGNGLLVGKPDGNNTKTLIFEPAQPQPLSPPALSAAISKIPNFAECPSSLLSDESIRPRNERSQTFPNDNQARDHAPGSSDSATRRPSESSINHPRRPSVSQANRPLYEIGSTSTYKGSRHGPSRSASPVRNEASSGVPRSTSRNGERQDPRLNGAPPVPAPTRAEEFNIGNPYHTPTESTSSNESLGSDANTRSSRSSPPLLDAPYVPDQAHKISPESTYGCTPTTTHPSQVDLRTPQEAPRTRRGPAKSFSRPTYARPVDVVAPDTPPESPMDPAFQRNRFAPLPSPDKQQVTSRPPQPEGPQPLQSHPYIKPSQSTRVPAVQVASQLTPNIPVELTRTAPPLPRPDIPNPARRPTTANKGKCRGCQEIITGKSVSSADGRLTGRYHKHCFVCQTCKEPFKTTDFYVHNNHPYCSRHYHELNGSLCKTCDRGIEGQYLETDVKQKFHPHCFTCQECHKILRDDYFELNNRILCEQHASRAAMEPSLLGPGRRYPERRTTRLLMM